MLGEKLGKVVGKGNVVTDKKKLEAFLSAYKGFDEPALPLCMVYAKTADEVKQIIDLAREEGVGLVPCSSEDSVKLTGSSLPSEGTEVILLNLARMNKIMRLDQKNRIVFVEPGVTFAQLDKALEGTGLVLERPFQARANKSVLTTLLDREPTIVPMNVWDVNDPLLCLEVVFGDGVLFRTGSAAGPGTLEEQWEAGVAMNNSMGPSHTDFGRVLSGSQGTLGIVTWASVKLEFAPSVTRMGCVEGKTVGEMAPFIHQSVKRRYGNHFVILNDFALGCTLGKNKKEIDSIAAKAPDYLLITSVVGKRIRPQQKVDYQFADMKEIAKSTGTTFKEDTKAVDYIGMEKIVSSLSDEPLWKLRYDGNAVDLFFLTTLDRADEFASVMKDAMGEAGVTDWPLAVYVQPSMQSRYCQVEFMVPYTEADTGSARKLYEIATDKLIENGAFFSRPHGPLTQKVFAKTPSHAASLEKLKDLFDADRVFNPGKLSYKEVARRGAN